MRWGRGALLALVVVVCALTAIWFVANSRESDEDDFEPLLERVVEAGAPGVVLLVRDGSTTIRSCETAPIHEMWRTASLRIFRPTKM